MEVNDQIEVFKEFIDTHYKSQLYEVIQSGKKSLILSFNDLILFNPELADHLLDDPENTARSAELAIEQFDLPSEVKGIIVRFNSLPETQKMRISDVRSEHLGKFLFIEGIVRQASDVRPQVTSAKFECAGCGNSISILQIDQKFKEPSRCTCGWRGKFRLLSKDLIDVQHLKIEESSESLYGGEQPKRLSVFLKEDLVEPKMERRTTPGAKIRIYGIVKEVPIQLKTGVPSTRYDLILEANNIEPVQEDYTNIILTHEDEEQILDLSKNPKVFDKFVAAIAPSIYGHDRIKEALVLQLFGGVRKEKPDGTTNRGDIHVLLVGDPGAGKCLHGNTKIVLSDGSIIKISDFVNSNTKSKLDGGFIRDNFLVPSVNFDGKSIYNGSNIVWKRKYNDNLIKITTQSGNEILVTKNHPLFTTTNGVIYSIVAENLKLGVHIATPNYIKVNGELQKLPPNFIRSISNNRINLKVPEFLDENLARFFGYLLGEGWGKLKVKGAMVSFTNEDCKLLEDFSSVLKLLGVNYTLRESHKGKSCKEIYCCSIEFARFIALIEPTLLMGSRYKKIPNLIKKSPNYILKEFLKAYFDSEAYVDKKDRVVEVSSASK